jgi:zinc/manganese transport system substrate-binding protein
MKKTLLFALSLTLTNALTAVAALNVVTTTEDLAAIAREVGGEKVSVIALSRGYQDPHFVDAKPSFLMKLSRADLFIEVGKELEVGWVPPLVTNSRNEKIQPAAPGNLDASRDVAVLELPTGQVSRAEGDVHPYGNPHYWLDPENGLKIAEEIRERLAQLSPDDAATFQERTDAFSKRLKESILAWNKRAEAIGLKGLPVVTYHRSWTYFAKAFGFKVVDFVEPRPGIPPSPAHMHELEHLMRAEKVRLLIVEPFYDIKLPEKIALESGARLVVLGPSVGWQKGVDSYFDLFEKNLDILSEALKEGGKQ